MNDEVMNWHGRKFGLMQINKETNSEETREAEGRGWTDEGRERKGEDRDEESAINGQLRQ